MWLPTIEMRGSMNYITVLLRSFIAAKDRAFSFVLVAEKMSNPSDVAKSETRQTLTERMLNTLYIQR